MALLPITLHKVYFKFNGIDYYDYDFITVQPSYIIREIKENHCVFSHSVEDYLANAEKNNLINISISVPKKSEICMATSSKYPIDDIRKHYTIKRGIDKGDYNVFSPFNSSLGYYTGIFFQTMLVNDVTKEAVVCRDDLNYSDMVTFTRGIAPNFDFSSPDVQYIRNNEVFYIRKDIPAWRDLLDNKIKKPCVYEDQLDLNSENKLTTDLLMMLIKTGQDVNLGDSAEKNYEIQLNVLNQHDWRNYPGTVCMALQIAKIPRSIAQYMSSSPSRYPKAVKNLLNHKFYGFKDLSDVRMGQELIQKLIEIGDCRFTTVSNLLSKLNDNHIPFGMFAQLFTDMVKITPKYPAL